MAHQRKHIRTSKKGTRFFAGRSGPIKVGDTVLIKNTVDAQWNNPSAIGRTGVVVKVAHEPFLFYHVKIKGQRGVWEAHQGEIKKITMKGGKTVSGWQIQVLPGLTYDTFNVPSGTPKGGKWTAFDTLTSETFGGLAGDAGSLARSKHLTDAKLESVLSNIENRISVFDEEYGEGTFDKIRLLIRKIRTRKTNTSKKKLLAELNQALYRFC